VTSERVENRDRIITGSNSLKNEEPNGCPEGNGKSKRSRV